MATSLPLSEIINVQLNVQPLAPSRRDFGVLNLMTPEAGQVFNDAHTLYAEYANANSVEQAFGSHSVTAQAARLFFAQTPRPKRLVVSRWVRIKRTLAATHSKLYGGPMTAPLEQLKAISVGYFSIKVGSSLKNYSKINLSSANTHEEIATLITAKTSADKLTVHWDSTGRRFIVEVDQAGASRTLSLMNSDGQPLTVSSSPSYLGTLLKLDSADAYSVAGTDAVTLEAQSLTEALSQLEARFNHWYALNILHPLTDVQIKEVANWVLAADKKILGITTSNPQHLEPSFLNVFKQLADQKNERVVALYDKDNPHAVLSWLARALSVNFAGNNTTITMKFKQLPGVTPHPLTLTEASQCKALGINYYTYFDETAMVAEGTVLGGRFFDEVHSLDWFVDAVQKEVVATLHRSPTKIPLTDAGTHQLLVAVESVCREGVRNGAFAAGVWRGDPFGHLHTGERLEEGFYVWVDTVDRLSSSDREARKAPPIQVALKLAGAIHAADILVNFDR
ncbi:Uncharacterized protein MCB1EB_1448 [Mycoavidus cysteinexigens]|uniref:Uncharacterized protein n=1 Tax=Mycoavidus cysteinexigens TaxID=1553431 RepID=A0A2Z6EW03_9BURK|nr:DUF3383 domain-containing protein [Mycoavidus cysteinexigens]BBE09609.1 Uncharacterized protein MCB1EB_1448 [Mycoavidus cysteinexigens]GAM51636.1 phage-related protein [bacterium endosymbiont of Mortierella elongata FMR23-6]GLR02249.1 hypothetical protein GCM10007934_20650 [Mycoavidus cysteinexigens]